MPIIFGIPALKDNYIWTFSDGHSAWVVDPGDANPVLKMLKEKNLKLAGILITHHHLDHSGGISELLKITPNIPVFGSHISRLSAITDRLSENDQINCGPYSFTIIEIPGHTLDHIAFYGENSLFCGDTLFSAGCGKVFEGTYSQMFNSLQKLKALPKKVQIYCGHEYTLSNLKFAHHVSPYNHDIIDKIACIQNLKCSLPSSLEDEMKINPFLRCETLQVIEAVTQYIGEKTVDPIQVFRILREWKNNF